MTLKFDTYLDVLRYAANSLEKILTSLKIYLEQHNDDSFSNFEKLIKDNNNNPLNTRNSDTLIPLLS
jgi:hypothetical protein